MTTQGSALSELSPLRRRGLSLAVMVAVALGVLATSLIATAAPEAPARSAPAGPGDFGRQLARSTQDFFATVATTMPAELGQRYASAALLAQAYRAAGVAEPATSSRPVVRTPAQASAYVREQTSAEVALLADLEAIGLVVSQARPGAHAYSLSAFAQPYAERWAGV